MCTWSLLSQLLSATLSTSSGYTVVSNYIVSLLRFHLSVDSVTKGAITKMENMTVHHLNKWFNLPRSATHAIRCVMLSSV